jgi:transcriptional antiterminator NusG
VATFGMQDYFEDILIPEEDVVELKKGEKKTSKRKFFPGYILVRMELTDETWHLVKETPKVTGFIGTKDRPSHHS